MTLTVQISKEWTQGAPVLKEGAMVVAIVRGCPCPVTVFRSDEIFNGFAVAGFVPGKGTEFYPIPAEDVMAWAKLPVWGLKDG